MSEDSNTIFTEERRGSNTSRPINVEVQSNGHVVVEAQSNNGDDDDVVVESKQQRNDDEVNEQSTSIPVQDEEGEEVCPPASDLESSQQHNDHDEVNAETPTCMTAQEEQEADDDVCTDASDLSRLDRTIWVVTTAGLPWRTGTAVNPLLRALYLTRGRKRHGVTLLIPWLAKDAASQQNLYGCVFKSQQEQEEWIRAYCRDRAGCKEEEENLRIMFWDGFYQEAFGSVFPTVDIVSLIPEDEADVAILEEPEHLNWFRVPSTDATDKDRLGWSHKFNHVVGVLHTNYAAYMKEYGMGTSMVTGPALNGLSSLVVRAYCHRVIRLSDTLPSLDPKKEVTSNIHGVRHEFLEMSQTKKSEKVSSDKKKAVAASVYFIGKLIWAKGFHGVLELEEKIKETTGEYFSIDVYGGGNDQAAIELAFFGRKQPEKGEKEEEKEEVTEQEEEDEVAAEIFGVRTSLRELLCQEQEATTDTSTTHTTTELTEQDREGVEGKEEMADMGAKEEVTDVDSKEDNSPMDIVADLSEKALHTGAETAEAAFALLECSLELVFGSRDEDEDEEKDSKNDKDTATTAGTTTIPATSQRQQKSFPFPLRSIPRPPHPMTLVPRRARYKWRTAPIPARFLGVQDHIIVRDIPEQYIFLNMSTSEVLCTTTAEALAMGKFAIIPKHPSNEFFYQFPNCLAYSSLDDCAVKLKYALKSQPEPLTEKYSHILSWEGATERLIKASCISKKEWKEWSENGVREADAKAAKFHVESGRKSQMVRSLFNVKTLAKSFSM